MFLLKTDMIQPMALTSLSMYYHYAIMLLFRQFVKLRMVGSSILPHDVCSKSADAIRGLLHSYSQLYTLRLTPSFVAYFVLASAITRLAVGALGLSPGESLLAAVSNTPTADPAKPVVSHTSHAGTSSSNKDESSASGTRATKLDADVAESIRRDIADLIGMTSSHQFAEQALHMLRHLAMRWNIEMNISQAKDVTSQEAERMAHPEGSSLNSFSPDMVEDDFFWPL